MATSYELGFGQPADLRALAEKVHRLAELVSLAGSAGIAWRSHVDAGKAELDDLMAMGREAHAIANVLILHCDGAAERLERRHLAAERAVKAAEVRGRRILAGLSTAALGSSFDPHGFFVYCLWGLSDEAPLYVGLSTNILSRLGSHLGDRTKRLHIERVTLQRFDTQPQMIAAEARLIAEYKPEWNIVGCSR